MFCKNCGAQLDDSARFCNVCGAQLGEASAVSSAPVQTEAVQPEATQPVAVQPEATQPASVQPVASQITVPQYSGQKLGVKSVPLPKFFGILALLMAILSVLMMWITPQVGVKQIYEYESYTQSFLLSDVFKELKEDIEYYEERITKLEKELDELRYSEYYSYSEYSESEQAIKDEIRNYEESIEEMKIFKIGKILYIILMIVGGLGVLLLLVSVIGSKGIKSAPAIGGVIALIVFLACMIVGVYVIIAGEVNRYEYGYENKFVLSGAGWIAVALGGMAVMMTTIGMLTNKKSDKQNDKSASVIY